MSTIKVQRIEKFSKFLEKRKKFMVLHGGRYSGKSHSVAQLFIRRLYEEEDIKMLVLRKTLPALKITALRLIIDLLNQYQLPYSYNKSVPITISYNDNEILFGSLDDPEKYKSFLGNYLWIEEATELSFEEFLKASLVMSRKNRAYQNQIFLTFNPVSCQHWAIKQFVDNPSRSDAAMLHSTHLDNPFLSPDVVQLLNNLINEDDALYQIYALGKCGELRNKIYSKYALGPYPDNLNRIAYGLDFGYNNPTAFLETGYAGEQCYERELLYQTHLTNQELIELLKQLVVYRSAPIYADPAEPARIAAIKQAGFNVLPANNSVNDGIDYVKSCHPILDENSPNLISEKQDYKWQKLNGVVIDKPVNFRDHLMAAERYALYTPSLLEEEVEPELVLPRLH